MCISFVPNTIIIMRVYDSLLKPATNVTHFVPVFYYMIRESHTSVYCTVVSTCNLVDKRIYEWNSEIIYFVECICRLKRPEILYFLKMKLFQRIVSGLINQKSEAVMFYSVITIMESNVHWF